MREPRTSTVFPEPGQSLGELAEALLGIAGDPRDVAYLPGENAFAVTRAVGDEYVQRTSAPAAPEPEPEREEAPRRRAARKATRQAEKE